jgi:hypothetical protein
MTTDNIVVLSRVDTKPKINNKLIENLEDLLRRAQSGEIIGAAYALVNNVDTISYGWSSAGQDFKLAAALSILQAEYVQGFGE